MPSIDQGLVHSTQHLYGLSSPFHPSPPHKLHPLFFNYQISIIVLSSENCSQPLLCHFLFLFQA